MSKSALNFQVGGNHYTKRSMQPLELAYLVNGTPCFTKVAKYMVREKGSHKEDLQKALSCVLIEEELTNKGIGLQYFAVSIDEDFVVSMIEKYTDVITYQMVLKDMYFGEYDKAKNMLQGLILEQG
ncbi:TPA: hypothetical protein MA058_003495 [Klebsiella pneumoniae]|nr:hypothetical protein [Klebsiella pneumoniae]